jgi:hypothetical protein
MKDVCSSNHLYQTARGRNPEDPHRMKAWLIHPITLLPDGLESELSSHTFVRMRLLAPFLFSFPFLIYFMTIFVKADT